MKNQRTDFEQDTIPSRSNILRAGRRDFLLSLGAGAAGAAALGATTFGSSSAQAQQRGLVLGTRPESGRERRNGCLAGEHRRAAAERCGECGDAADRDNFNVMYNPQQN
jgi:hypothetical protein